MANEPRGTDQPEDGRVPDQPDKGATPDQPDKGATTMRLSAVGSTETGTSGETTAPAVDPGTLASLRPGTALLRVDHGPNAGSRFLLDADLTTVGRHPNSDIFLDDVTVSRKHAEFRRNDGTFTVHDVGSLNGTYVNRERIDSATTVQTGDEVQIGKFRLVVHLAQPGERE